MPIEIDGPRRRLSPGCRGDAVIRGIVYLAGLLTLGFVALLAAIAYKVHLWPWDRYVESGREFLAERLVGSRERSGHGDACAPPRTDSRPDEPAAGRPVLARHTVRRGETLYAIAVLHYGDGELWPELARANSIRRPSDLRVGSVIVVPAVDAVREGTDGHRPASRGRQDAEARGERRSARPEDAWSLALTPALEAEGGRP